MNRQSFYVAVRRTKDSGKEWFDVDTFSTLGSYTQQKADKVNVECGPGWAQMNPVVSIAHVSVMLETELDNMITCARGSLAALTQNKTYPADIAAAREWLRDGGFGR